jgi:hypothetical protein
MLALIGCPTIQGLSPADFLSKEKPLRVLAPVAPDVGQSRSPPMSSHGAADHRSTGSQQFDVSTLVLVR